MARCPPDAERELWVVVAKWRASGNGIHDNLLEEIVILRKYGPQKKEDIAISAGEGEAEFPAADTIAAGCVWERNVNRRWRKMKHHPKPQVAKKASSAKQTRILQFRACQIALQRHRKGMRGEQKTLHGIDVSRFASRVSDVRRRIPQHMTEYTAK